MTSSRPEANSRLLSELTTADVASNDWSAAVVVVPVASIEQHGPHLPFATDAIVADHIAREAVERCGAEINAWRLPIQCYGRAVEHTWSPGTMSLSTETFAAVLQDLGRSVASLGAGRLVFLNGHGGNDSLLRTVIRDIRLDTGILTFTTSTYPHPETTEEFDHAQGGQGIHGDATETSMILHLRPELVDMSAAQRRLPGPMAANRHLKFGGSVQFGWLANDFGPDGYLGSPELATAEIGARCVNNAVDRFESELREIARFDFADYQAR